jgi:hypothetical protein
MRSRPLRDRSRAAIALVALALAPAADKGFAAEIADRPHLFAVWGRGSLIGSAGVASPAEQKLQPVRTLVHGVVSWFYRINEIGLWLRVRDDGVHVALRVRTIWANPDELVAAIEDVIEASPIAGRRRARLVALAERFPDSPLAGDLRAGQGGLALEGVALGGMSAFVAWATRRAMASLPWSFEAAGTAAGARPDRQAGPDPRRPRVQRWSTGSIAGRTAPSCFARASAARPTWTACSRRSPSSGPGW